MQFLMNLTVAAAALLSASCVSAENFVQPILWQDLPDIDIIRVGDAYYYSASNMHFSPGAPILRSYDLVNWEYLSHSIPVYDVDNPKFDLDGGNVYNGGVYASSLRYNEVSETFYWIGCLQQVGRTYVYSAKDIEGPWTQTSVVADYCFYDDGLLFDDDGKIYIAYGKWIADGNSAQIWAAELTEDFQVKGSVTTAFHTTPELGYIEGCRFYKINGTYYILVTNPGVGNGEIILKSSGDALGPYDTWHRILENNGKPVPGASSPYQGTLVETESGDWWYMAFVNRYPGGRIPVLAPLHWDDDGWPNVEFVNGADWGSTYPYPLPRHNVKPINGTDDFASEKLGPQYEWNHNPDNTKWTIGAKDGGGLTLQTATVTDDFFSARNTLSHRILGPASIATIELDYSGLKDGDRAGLAVFRYDAAWIGVSKTGPDTLELQMVNNILMESTNGWHTTNKGGVISSETLPSSGSIWLRVKADISSSTGTASFYYSADGTTFSQLGEKHVMADGAVFFMGDRYGMFNFATKNLGGEAVVKSFTLEEA